MSYYKHDASNARQLSTNPEELCCDTSARLYGHAVWVSVAVDVCEEGREKEQAIRAAAHEILANLSWVNPHDAVGMTSVICGILSGALDFLGYSDNSGERSGNFVLLEKAKETPTYVGPVPTQEVRQNFPAEFLLGTELIAFEGGLRQFFEFDFCNCSNGDGYIYAIHFKTGRIKVGSSKNPHTRADTLLSTQRKAGSEDDVEKIVVIGPMIDVLRQELALHKLLPQDGRVGEFFVLNAEQYQRIISTTLFKIKRSSEELEALATKAQRQDAMSQHLRKLLFEKPAYKPLR